MKISGFKKLSGWTFLCLLTFTLSCEDDKKENYDLLISNVNIIDVESGNVAKNQLIFINGDSISRIDDASNMDKYEAGQKLDANGKYVMPGLWDMHVHFRGGDSLIEENKNLLPLFLSYGVTTIRDAGGDMTPEVLKWRAAIEKKEMDGPRIFTSGPKLDGDNPAWPGSISVTSQEEINAALDSLQVLGVDYVKMYDGSLTPEAYYGIIQEAEKRGLKTTGHMPLAADFMKAVNFGLDGAEHMYYPLKATSPVADSLSELNMGYGMMDEIINTYDPVLAEKVFSEMSRNEVFITPTLHIGTTLAEILEVDHTKDTVLPFVGKGIQRTYKGRIEGAKRAKASGSTMREKMEEKSAEMIRPMQDAGMKIVAGSDSGAFNSFVYPGESLQKEIYALVEAGLSPQEALQTSVINGPEFFDILNKYGAVSDGKTADLLLLNNNPLEDINNLNDIFAVIKAGKVYTRKELQEMLNNASGN
ncbi:amidohydrolase family protein [Autumnicola musiva]|uniref:Amidohydrolase family protein n=1 Tax=Autumnicola musiva TaxID=3075589 RepID=A0ABU3D257_9FLAO|nr:amidohydrolase family protein [Zunongwangia sp. F117]MDT0675622.1 amidohydrolase family protein [Zunongwangia sp. F117]